MIFKMGKLFWLILALSAAQSANAWDFDPLDLLEVEFWEDLWEENKEKLLEETTEKIVGKLVEVADEELNDDWSEPYIGSKLSSLHETVNAYGSYNNRPTITTYPSSLTDSAAKQILEDPVLMQYRGKPFYESKRKGFDQYDGTTYSNALDASIRYSGTHESVLISWNRQIYNTPCNIPSNDSGIEFSIGINIGFGSGGDIFDANVNKIDYNKWDNLKGVWDYINYEEVATDKIMKEMKFKVYRVVDGDRTNIVKVYWGGQRGGTPDYEIIKELGFWDNRSSQDLLKESRFYVVDNISDIPAGSKVEYIIDGYDESRDPKTVFPDGQQRGSCDAQKYADHVPEAMSKLLLDEEWDGTPEFYETSQILYSETELYGIAEKTHPNTGNRGSYDAYSKQVGDVNGDGNDDLIWMYSGGGGLVSYTALSNGDGTFSTAVRSTVNSGNRGSYGAYSKRVGDVNGDGNDDLIWMYSGGGGLVSYTALSNGDGTFLAAVRSTVNTGNRGSYGAHSKHVGDVNGDGYLDSIWMFSGDTGLATWIALGNGDGTFLAATKSKVDSGNRGSYDAYSKHIEDVNNDGYLDSIWMNSGDMGLIVYTALGRGDGTFVAASRSALNSGSRGAYSAYSKKLGDINGDTKVDLIWMYSGTSGLVAYSSLSTYSKIYH